MLGSGITAAQREAYGDALLPLFMLAIAGGVLSCVGTGAALPVARLVDGGAGVFLSSLLFLQGQYMAAHFDRSATIAPLAALGALLVADAVMAELRIARARHRGAQAAATEAERRHNELLAALKERQTLACDCAGGAGTLVIRLPWGPGRHGRTG